MSAGRGLAFGAAGLILGGPLLAAGVWFLAACGPAPAAGPVPTPQPAREVTLFVALPDGGYGQQPYQVPQQATEPEQIRSVVERLAAKPEHGGDVSVWPFPLRPRAAYLERDGVLVLDLDDAVQYNQAAGARAELLALRSLVRTLTQNFSKVRAVKLLMNGSEPETLAGHVDISRPLGEDDLAP